MSVKREKNDFVNTLNVKFDYTSCRHYGDTNHKVRQLTNKLISL